MTAFFIFVVITFESYLSIYSVNFSENSLATSMDYSMKRDYPYLSMPPIGHPYHTFSNDGTFMTTKYEELSSAFNQASGLSFLIRDSQVSHYQVQLVYCFSIFKIFIALLFLLGDGLSGYILCFIKTCAFLFFFYPNAQRHQSLAELELAKTYDVPTQIENLLYSNPEILKDAY